MLKWIFRAFLVFVLGSIGWSVYGYIRGGYHNLPDFNDTSYVASFGNGLRAIVVDPVVSVPYEFEGGFRYLRQLNRANPDRRYFSAVFEVPSWFEDAWAFCHAPDEAEKKWVDENNSAENKANLVGARFEAICYIEADDTRILRGLIYSVPKL